MCPKIDIFTNWAGAHNSTWTRSHLYPHKIKRHTQKFTRTCCTRVGSREHPLADLTECARKSSNARSQARPTQTRTDAPSHARKQVRTHIHTHGHTFRTQTRTHARAASCWRTRSHAHAEAAGRHDALSAGAIPGNEGQISFFSVAKKS